MSTTQPLIPPARKPLHWPSLIQLILSLLAAFILFGAFVAIVLSASFQYFTPGAAATDPTGSFMIAASLAFAGALVLPSAWYAWKHLAYPDQDSHPVPERRGFGLALTIAVLVLVAGALLLGNWAAQNNLLTWLVLPPLNIIATGLPALWVVYVGTRGLIPAAPRRKWGVFAGGLVLGPLVILILELILLVVIGILAIFWAMLNPSLANQLNSLVFRLQNSGPNLDAVINQLVPFLLNPGIIFLVFAFISILVPLLEEALKSIGVWFLAGQKISPAQGFGYGVLSGAGFGLFENLGNTSGGAADWVLLASTRISTLLLHSFTAGLMGWALVSAWSERRYFRLAITYAVAVVLHGLWNGMALLSAAGSLQDVTTISLPTYLQQISSLSSDGIIFLSIIVLLFYFGSNAFLRRSLTGNLRDISFTSDEKAQALKPVDELPSPEVDEALQPQSPINTNSGSAGDDHSNLENETKHAHDKENSTPTGNNP